MSSPSGEGKEFDMKRPIKILWIDTETTGLDPRLNDVVQIGGIIEVVGVSGEEFEIKSRPNNWSSVNKDAIDTHGISIDELKQFPPSSEAHLEFKKLLFKYVDPFDPYDKLIPAGHNVGFDVNMLHEFCVKQGDEYLFSCLSMGQIDLKVVAALYELHCGERVFVSYKLSRICEKLGVSLTNAHSAVDDIRATRDCCVKLLGLMMKE